MSEPTKTQSPASRSMASVQFRLRAPELDFYVDVRLRNFGVAEQSPEPADTKSSGQNGGTVEDRGNRFAGRWVAVAEIAGERELGLAMTPRGALSAALSSLGPSATEALLADPSLLGISGLLHE